MVQPTVFISYSQDDLELVKIIHDKLSEKGIPVWRDQKSIYGGDTWPKILGEAIRDSDFVLLCWSQQAKSSYFVELEWTTTLALKKPIIPLLLDEAPLPPSLSSRNGIRSVEAVIEALKQARPSRDTKREDAVIKKLASYDNAEPQVISESIRSIYTKIENSTNRNWKYVSAFVVFIGFLASMAEISGYSLKEIFSSTSPASASVTVLVHGEGGQDETILPNRGIVKLVYGDAIVSKQINNEGEATFKQVPHHFFQSNAPVRILFEDPMGEPYRSINRDSLYYLKISQHIFLPVKLYGLGNILGVVKDFETGAPIDSARVSIQGEETYSNRYGEYTLILPPDKQRQFQTVRAYKESYQAFEMNNIPVQTQEEIDILMKSLPK